MSLRAKCAIAGLGQTRMGKTFDHSGPIGFAVEAVNLALEDAGLQRADLDGLLVNPGITWFNNPMASSSLQHAMGLRDLRLTATMNLGGATAAAMIMHAAQAIARRHGRSRRVRLRRRAPESALAQQGRRQRWRFGRILRLRPGLDAHYGLFGVNAHYAFVARRHMDLLRHHQRASRRGRGSQRKWANLNPAGSVLRHADVDGRLSRLAMGG